MFRPWQGWTSLSATGPGEGTLRVLPLLALASAYVMLRPFFRARAGGGWAADLASAAFPGSAMGKAQELSAATHPHLRLAETMVSIPRVEPGDRVYCASAVGAGGWLCSRGRDRALRCCSCG